MKKSAFENLKITGIEIDKTNHCVKAITSDQIFTVEWDADKYMIRLFKNGSAIHVCNKEVDLLYEKMSVFCRENYNINMSLLYAGKTDSDVGSCTLTIDDGELKYDIDRGCFGEGWVFKSFKNYLEKPDDPCYVPELSDSIYTANTILELCRGQKPFADQLFGNLDWQHPESEFDDMILNGEWVVCEKCGKLVNYMEGSGDLECPFCGEEVEE